MDGNTRSRERGGVGTQLGEYPRNSHKVLRGGCQGSHALKLRPANRRFGERHVREVGAQHLLACPLAHGQGVENREGVHPVVDGAPGAKQGDGSEEIRPGDDCRARDNPTEGVTHEVYAPRGPGPCLGDRDEVRDKVTHPVGTQAHGSGGTALASLRVGEGVPAVSAQEGKDGRVVLL